MKARNADRKYNGVREGEVGRVERKLVELGEIKRQVGGNSGGVSRATHQLLRAMATSRVRVTGPMVERSSSDVQSNDEIRCSHSKSPELQFTGPSGVTWPWVCCCQEQAVAGF